MKYLWIWLLTPILWAQAPATTAERLTSDRVEIYRLFLQSDDFGSSRPVNIAKYTMPLALSEDDSQCLRSLRLGNLYEAASTVHEFMPDDLRQLKVVLVDPGTPQDSSADDAAAPAFSADFLKLSEIAFTRDGNYAVMRYVFQCGGGICGTGETLLFRLTNGRWKRLSGRCGSLLS